jgi:membrane associated rhomboid family serine protease
MSQEVDEQVERNLDIVLGILGILASIGWVACLVGAIITVWQKQDSFGASLGMAGLIVAIWGLITGVFMAWTMTPTEDEDDEDF